MYSRQWKPSPILSLSLFISLSNLYTPVYNHCLNFRNTVSLCGLLVDAKRLLDGKEKSISRTLNKPDFFASVSSLR